MDDIAAVSQAIADLGTVGILVTFIWAIWKDHQLQQERIYEITLRILERALESDKEEAS